MKFDGSRDYTNSLANFSYNYYYLSYYSPGPRPPPEEPPPPPKNLRI